MNDILPFVIAGIVTGAILGLAGTGLVLTYKTTGIFNFGHGAAAAGAAYAFHFLHVDQDWPWWAAFVLVVLGLGPLFGLLLALIGGRVARQPPVLRIVATVGVILVVHGLATAYYGDDPLLMRQYLPLGDDTFQLGGVYITYAQVTIAALSVLLAGALYLFIQRGRWGLAMRAVVDDPDLVDLHGTHSARVRQIAWVAGATLAALSGVLVAPLTGVQAAALTFLVVQAFGAAAFGAFSSLALTFVGALVIGVSASVATRYVVDTPALGGLPTALPFAFLVLVPLLIPRRRLAQQARPEPRPATRWRAPARARIAAGAVAVGLLALVPAVVGTRLSFFTVGLTQAILVLSLGLLVRMAGLVSLCQAAFAAVGAAAFGQLMVHTGLPWLVALPLGALAVVPIAALLALPAIRLSGLFLALATFGFGLVTEAAFYPRDYFFTSAGAGQPMPRPAGFTGDEPFYYLVLAAFALVALLLAAIHRGRLGRVLRGVGESPLAVGTLGLNVNLSRLIVFCVSGFLAGIAGILYGSAANYAVIGDLHYSAFYSLVLLAILIISPGREPWYAAVAVISAVVPAYLTASSVDSWLNVLFGCAAVLVAMRGGIPPMPRAVRLLAERLGGPSPADPARIVPTAARGPEELGTSPPLPASAAGARPPAGGAATARNPGMRHHGGARTGLEVVDLSVRFGGRVAVDGVTLAAPTGQITGLIGPNGAGKTTVLNAVSGLLRPSGGRVRLHGRDVTRLGPGARGRLGLGRTFQLMQLADSLTVAENVGLGVESALAGSSLRGQVLCTRPERRRIQAAVEEALVTCGIADLRGHQAGALSTGQRRLVELARCLAGDFDLLLLDEPSSGLDPIETDRFGVTLTRIVAERGHGVLLVEHDMELVLNICAQIHVLDFGRHLFTGTAEQVRASATVRAAYLGTAEEGGEPETGGGGAARSVSTTGARS